MKKVSFYDWCIDNQKEELLKQWHPTKNNDLSPRDIPSHSLENVWWIFPYDDERTGKHFDFEWESRVVERIHHANCPFLIGTRLWKGFNDVETIYPELVKEWSPENEKKPNEVLFNTTKKIKWLCPKHPSYPWETTISARNNHVKCTICSGKYILPGFNDLATLNPELAKEWHPTKNGNLKPENMSLYSNEIVWWLKHYVDKTTGKEFDFEWKASVNGRNKRGCPYLSNPPRKIMKGFNDLQTLFPEVANYWHPTKNGTLTPTDVFPGSNKIVWWFFSYDDERTGKHFDFEWEDKIISMKKSCSCPFLANRKVWEGFNDVATLYPQLIEEWSPENEYKPNEIIPGSTKRIKWICKNNPNHKWEAILHTRTAKNVGCPFCAGQKVTTGSTDIATTHPKLALEWDPKNRLKPTEVSKGSIKKVKWICPVNPLHRYEATTNDRVSGKGCPFCAGRKILPGDNDLQTLHPQIAAEWDKEKNGKLKPTMISANNMRMVWWKCPVGHSYKTAVASRTAKKTNCPICSNKKLLTGYNDLQAKYPEIAAEWDPENKIPPSKIIAGSSFRAKWICKNNPSHKWTTSVSNRTFNKTGCPICNTSHGEILISEILIKNNINFKAEYKIENCVSVSALPFDFAVFSHNQTFLIEYDGLQHFKSIDMFGGTKGFAKRKKNDLIKNQFCLKNKIPLLRIPYIYDYNKDKEEIEKIILKFINENKVSKEIKIFYEKENSSYIENIKNNI